MSFPAGTEMFQFPAYPSLELSFSFEDDQFRLAGLPHSEISGSSLVASYPELIAGYHVFHRP